MNARKWLYFLLTAQGTLALINFPILSTEQNMPQTIMQPSISTRQQEPTNTSKISTKLGTKNFVARRRVHAQNRKKKTTLSKKSYDELKIVKEQHMLDNNKDAAIRCIERMLKTCDEDNIHEIAGLLLDLGDLYFDSGKIEKAEKIYNEFYRQYPGHERTEYALYRAIICNYSYLLSFDRDQTKTNETIALTETFLGKSLYKQYRKEVRDIRKRCYELIISSELNVCQFYANQQRYKVVDTRLKHIREQLLPKIPSMEAHVLVFEYSLAERQNNPALAEEKRALFMTKSTGHEQEWKVAEKALKRNFAYRF